MKLLLDTHTFLWMSLDDPQLSETSREKLSDNVNELYLSPASYWEIAIKISIGKYDLSNLLPINVDHAAQVSQLPFHHKDPFDRMLVAQSLAESLPIVSGDGIFDQYGVTRIW